MSGSHPSARMLAVASGKGGVGKTALATGLAQALALRGRRVLLFDGDLGMANVDVQLGLSPRADLGAVIAGRATLEQAVTPALPDGPMRFDVIAGRSGSGALAGLSPLRAQGLAAALTAVSLSYDWVLMDLAAGADPALLRLAAAADEILVVLMDEPTSLTDAYAFAKMLRLHEEGAAPMVAVNMADTTEQARRAHEGFARTCRAFLDFDPEYVGAVRRDPSVPAAIRRQQALFETNQDGPAARDIARIAAHLDKAARAQAA